MASKTATSSGDSAPKTGGRLQRSRSAEDLSREKLKSTESDTVIIFIEYVRKKLGNTTPRTADLDEAIERERRQRETRSHSGREGKKKRGFLRRLQSEPNGPKNSELWKHTGNDRADDELQSALTKATETERPTRLVLQDPPSGIAERRKNRKSSSTNKRSASTASSTTSSTDRCTSASGRDGSCATSTPARASPVAIPTPADPPLSPCCENTTADFVSSYPPPSAHRLRAAPSPVTTLPSIVTGVPVSQEHFCTAQQPPLTPQMSRATRDSKWRRQNHARIIANKLKIFGDEISFSHEEEIQREFAHMINTQNPQAIINFFSIELRHMLVGLSWQNIGKVFHLSYHLIEVLTALLGPTADVTGSPEWIEFSELWDFTLGSVTRWIFSNGGWGAFPADSSTTPAQTSEQQPTCPATPSFRRVRSQLLSLSESGEFVDEQGHPHSADTVSTASSETGLSDDREDLMGSSVDLLHDPLEESSLESSLTTTSPPHLPATITPYTVTPPCLPRTLQNGTTPSPKHSPRERITSGSSRPKVRSSASCSTVAFSNGIPQLTTASHDPPTQRRKSNSVTERSPKKSDNVTSTAGVADARAQSAGAVNRDRSGSLPTGAVQRHNGSARRTSQTALNGLVFGVGGAAMVYAAVYALMRR